MDPKEFIDDYLHPLVEKISSENKLCFLMGDFNLNLIKTSSHSQTKSFINSLSSYFFSPYILQPTRVTEKSKTLIDNIFFNSLEYESFSGNITAKISDHLLQFVVLKDFTLSNDKLKRQLYARDYRKFNHQNFSNDLANLDWDIKPQFDASFAFTWFHDSLDNLLNAPWRSLTQREISLRAKPWLNNDIQKLMRKRDKMFKKYCDEKNPLLKNQIHDSFKILRNNASYSINLSKKKYYENYFEMSKTNLSKTWKGIRELVTLKSKSKHEPKSLRVDNLTLLIFC